MEKIKDKATDVTEKYELMSDGVVAEIDEYSGAGVL